MITLTIGSDASALGMTEETANPSAQNAAAPIASMISIRRRVASVGVHGVDARPNAAV